MTTGMSYRTLAAERIARPFGFRRTFVPEVIKDLASARPGHIVRRCPRRRSTAPRTRSQGIERGERRGCWQDRNAHGLTPPAVVRPLGRHVAPSLLIWTHP